MAVQIIFLADVGMDVAVAAVLSEPLGLFNVKEHR